MKHVYTIVCLIVLCGCMWWYLNQHVAEDFIQNEMCTLADSTPSIDIVEDKKPEISPSPAIPVLQQKLSTTSRRIFQTKRRKKKKWSPNKAQSTVYSAGQVVRAEDPTTGQIETPRPHKAGVFRNIVIHSTIETAMLTVKHWTGTYTPTLLTITIGEHVIPIVTNGTLEPPQPYTISVEDDTFTVEYYYEFMNGMRKERNMFQYMMTEQTDQLDMSFAWSTPWHVAFDKAKPRTS
jgi:hypothetical protein